MTRLARAVSAAESRLEEVYQLDLACRAREFLMDAEAAQEWLSSDGPRSGVLVMEEAEEVWLGLYLDPEDAHDAGTIIEETSHLLCLVWHASQGRPVSQLVLELQSEVDRYVLARLSGADGLGHFRNFRWGQWARGQHQERYQRAHQLGFGYCQALERRFPSRSDTPGMLQQLRRFYRAPSEEKLSAAIL